ncbi:hypothetical protein [Geoalkalibacter subterraneus]|uniref:hypothetical protein n=1 Tax=Geoalkalibacter subterraneus TaxID=483547 RepID=UPI001184A61D|nr:hypothetical protein [Geoalkalibacter subterraneus]
MAGRIHLFFCRQVSSVREGCDPDLHDTSTPEKTACAEVRYLTEACVCAERGTKIFIVLWISAIASTQYKGDF